MQLVFMQIKKHPQYSSRNLDNDVAVLRLAQELDLTGPNSYLGSVCLPDLQPLDAIANASCIATGWGNTQWSQ